MARILKVSTYSLTVLALIVAVGVSLGGYRIVSGNWPLQSDESDPKVTGVKSVQELLPFDILTPTYLPSGYGVGQVSVQTRPKLVGGRVAFDEPPEPFGVVINYTTEEGIVPGKMVLLEQSLGTVSPEDVMANGVKEDVVKLQGLDADLWKVQPASGLEMVALRWEDPVRGIVFDVTSFLSEDETLKIARSLQ